jgi:hypothetical protein
VIFEFAEKGHSMLRPFLLVGMVVRSNEAFVSGEKITGTDAAANPLPSSSLDEDPPS